MSRVSRTAGAITVDINHGVLPRCRPKDHGEYVYMPVGGTRAGGARDGVGPLRDQLDGRYARGWGQGGATRAGYEETVRSSRGCSRN